MYARIGESKRELFQWDTGQFLEVSEDVTRVDFCFRENAKMVYGVFAKNGRVSIPDIMLQQAGIMDALIMGSAGGAHTVTRMEITVIERPLPPGYVVSPQGGIFSYDDLADLLVGIGVADTKGFTMSGDIDMADYRVRNLDDPEDEGDAVPRKWAEDKFLPLSGGTITGRLRGLKEPIAEDEPATKKWTEDNFFPVTGGSLKGKLSGIPAPTEESDAANKKYVDEAKKVFTDIMVPASVFSEDDTYPDYPFKASVTLVGAIASMIPEVVLPVQDEVSFAPVTESYNGGIYIYADDIPSNGITIPTIILWRGDSI